MLNGRYGRVQESLIVLTAEGTGGGELVGRKVEIIDVLIIAQGNDYIIFNCGLRKNTMHQDVYFF